MNNTNLNKDFNTNFNKNLFPIIENIQISNQSYYKNYNKNLNIKKTISKRIIGSNQEINNTKEKIIDKYYKDNYKIYVTEQYLKSISNNKNNIFFIRVIIERWIPLKNSVDINLEKINEIQFKEINLEKINEIKFKDTNLEKINKIQFKDINLEKINKIQFKDINLEKINEIQFREIKLNNTSKNLIEDKKIIENDTFNEKTINNKLNIKISKLPNHRKMLNELKKKYYLNNIDNNISLYVDYINLNK